MEIVNLIFDVVLAIAISVFLTFMGWRYFFEWAKRRSDAEKRKGEARFVTKYNVVNIIMDTCWDMCDNLCIKRNEKPVDKDGYGPLCDDCPFNRLF